uniref:Uncharacterized protein n=1 Tax=Anguilla anguilla TaxID=7936 RepID=A0A0E9T5J7_ANGAN
MQCKCKKLCKSLWIRATACSCMPGMKF